MTRKILWSFTCQAATKMFKTKPFPQLSVTFTPSLLPSGSCVDVWGRRFCDSCWNYLKMPPAETWDPSLCVCLRPTWRIWRPSELSGSDSLPPASVSGEFAAKALGGKLIQQSHLVKGDDKLKYPIWERECFSNVSSFRSESFASARNTAVEKDHAWPESWRDKRSMLKRCPPLCKVIHCEWGHLKLPEHCWNQMSRSLTYFRATTLFSAVISRTRNSAQWPSKISNDNKCSQDQFAYK